MKLSTVEQTHVSLEIPALCPSSEDNIVGFILDVGKDSVLRWDHCPSFASLTSHRHSGFHWHLAPLMNQTQHCCFGAARQRGQPPHLCLLPSASTIFSTFLGSLSYHCKFTRHRLVTGNTRRHCCAPRTYMSYLNPKFRPTTTTTNA